MTQWRNEERRYFWFGSESLRLIVLNDSATRRTFMISLLWLCLFSNITRCGPRKHRLQCICLIYIKSNNEILRFNGQISLPTCSLCPLSLFYSLHLVLGFTHTKLVITASTGPLGVSRGHLHLLEIFAFIGLLFQLLRQSTHWRPHFNLLK